MTKNDKNFHILLELAARRCMEKELADFDALDISDVTVSDRTVRKVRNRILMQKIRDTRILLYAKRIIIAVMAIITVTFAGAMCIQPIRAAFWNAVITWYEKYVEVQFVEEAEVEYPETIEKRMLPTYLPDGWTIEILYEDDLLIMYQVIGTDGEVIGYDQIVYSSKDSIWYDNNNCVNSEIILKNGNAAQLFTCEDDSYVITWLNQYMFTATSLNIPFETVLNIINSIK